MKLMFTLLVVWCVVAMVLGRVDRYGGGDNYLLGSSGKKATEKNPHVQTLHKNIEMRRNLTAQITKL